MPDIPEQTIVNTNLNSLKIITALAFQKSCTKNSLICQDKIRKGTQNETGSGLGLWLIHYLLQKNNGRISINAHTNPGTEITITLNPPPHASTEHTHRRR